jgi:ABC-type uncharacterized transport system involved in gliding motility auxiliary subunit
MMPKGNSQVWLKRIAGVVGGVLAFGGVILFGIAPELTLVITGIEVAALALLVYFFFGHFELIKTFTLRRSTRLGANSLLMVLLFLVILGILNFILSRHSKRFDLSETGKFSLAPQTLKVLGNLGHEVKVTGFFQEGSRPRQEFKDLIESYGYYSGKLNYEFIDPDRKPAVAKQYGINQYNIVVLENGKQETRIKPALDVVSEEELTNALIRVSREQRKVVYFLEGHGEHALDDSSQTGYSQAKEALEREGYEVKALSILKEGKIPQDITILVLAGPQRSFLGAEKDAIRRYLQGKGQLLLMLDPQEKTGLDDLLAEWGLILGHEIIVDPSPNLTLLGFDASNALVLNYTPHDIVKDLRLATLFPVSRSIRFSSTHAQNLNYQALAQTGPDSWGETDFASRQARFDPTQDRKGPLDIAAVVERRGEEGENKPSGARLVVFGDSDFAANGYFNFSGNSDLFMASVNWLAQEKDLIAIRPKEAKFAPLTLTPRQGRIFFYFPVIVLPAMVIVVGVGVWRRRKKL